MEVFDGGRVKLCDIGSYELLQLASMHALDGVFGLDLRAQEIAPGIRASGSLDPTSLPAIAGPTLLGSGVQFGDGCQISHSVVGSGVRIGAGAAVSNCVLLPGSVVPGNAEIEGAVFGDAALVWQAMRRHAPASAP